MARTLSVPPSFTVTSPPAVISRAGLAPEVVVRFRSIPAPSPSAVVPLVLARMTPPAFELVEVRASKTLSEPMLVLSAASALPPCEVIEIVPSALKFVVPALLRSTPVAPAAVSTSRSEMFQVPLVPLRSSPA